MTLVTVTMRTRRWRHNAVVVSRLRPRCLRLLAYNWRKLPHLLPRSPWQTPVDRGSVNRYYGPRALVLNGETDRSRVATALATIMLMWLPDVAAASTPLFILQWRTPMNLRIPFMALLLIAVGAVAGCSPPVVEQEATAPQTQPADTVEPTTLTIYKNPGCSCCDLWQQRLHDAGLNSHVVQAPDVQAVKQRHGIKVQYQSCHTAVSTDGYVFEGHVPARYISQFLASPPADALGLAVPAMPKSAPGMEVAGAFEPYQVLVLMTDGSSRVFATVTTAGEQ